MFHPLQFSLGMRTLCLSFSVKPHLSDEEYESTETLVREFGHREGKDLHFKLCEYAKHKRNWVHYVFCSL